MSTGAWWCRRQQCFVGMSIVLSTGVLFWRQEHCFVPVWQEHCFGGRSIVLSIGAWFCRQEQCHVDRSIVLSTGAYLGLGACLLAGRPGAWGRPGACLAGLKCRKRRIVRGLARPGKLGALKKVGRSDVLEAWQVENLGRSGVLEAWQVENVGRSDVLKSVLTFQPL